MKKSNRSLSDRDPKLLDISIITAIYNEEENIEELYSRLSDVLKKLNKSYEILFVDDGSTDKSYQILKEIHQKDKRIKIIKFSRNFGHHIALTAGLNHCRGEAVVMMDADLQDRPEDIPAMYSKLQKGHDIVYALHKTQEATFLDKITSKFFYKILNKLSDIEVTQNISTFRIMRRKVVDNFNRLTEKSRFLTGLINWFGFNSTFIEVEKDKRIYGKTKYNSFKRLKLAVTGIISFSRFPLHIAGYLGFMIAGISFLLSIYLLLRKILYDIPIPGYTSIMVSIFFLGGIILVILGFIGEYIGKIYSEILDRPLYVIENLIESEKEENEKDE